MELGKTIDEIEIGESASFAKTISESDVYLFAGITGDFNLVHINEEYARQTLFRGRVVHGALTTSFMFPVLGTKLPGLGTIAVEVTTRYKAPVRFGDTVTATAEVIAKDVSANRLRMKLTWSNQDGAEVAEGEALVMPPTRKLKERFAALGRGG